MLFNTQLIFRSLLSSNILYSFFPCSEGSSEGSYIPFICHTSLDSFYISFLIIPVYKVLEFDYAAFLLTLAYVLFHTFFMCVLMRDCSSWKCIYMNSLILEL